MGTKNENKPSEESGLKGRVATKAEKKAKAIEANEKLFETGERHGKAAEAMNSMFSEPASKAFSFAINSAAKAETIGVKFNKMFNGMEEGTKSWAEVQASSIGKSVFDIQSYLMETHEMLTGMGATKEESVELSKQIVALGLDYAAFHDLSDTTAIQSLTMAITGNADAFSALGIATDEHVLSLVMQNEQLENNKNQQAIYDAILMQSGEILGSSEQRVGTFAGQMERLKAITEVTAIKFGEIMLPVLTEIITKVGDVVNWFGQLDDWQQIIIIGIGVFAMALGPLLSLMSNMVIIVGAVGAASAWMFLIPAAILAIVTMFALLYKKVEGFRNFIDFIASKISLLGKILFFGKSEKSSEVTTERKHAGAGRSFATLYKGTNYHPGGLALVGERGPELLNLPKGSKVATNYRTETMLNKSNSVLADSSIESNISSSNINMPFSPHIVVNVAGGDLNESKTFSIKKEIKDQILPMLEEYFSIMRLKHPVLIER